MIIGIIPARSGSKGVSKKNIKLLGGYPLIAYTIAAAKQAKEIDRVIVSTDSKEIAEIAKTYGAEVPFLRPKEFATDNSPDMDFILHALDWLKENENIEPELLVHLRPTTPLRDPELIDSAIQSIKKNNKATSLRSAHEMPESPHKVFEIKNGFWVGLFPNDPRPEYYNLPRQTFPLAYHPNGYVDIIKPDFVRKNNSLHGPRMLAFITPVSIEVDQPEDFEYLGYIINKKGHKLYDYLKSNFPEKKITPMR